MLPSGVVTFLLTDIEGSTRLWEREPEAMHTALARHDAIVHACVRHHHGDVVKSKGEGDSAFVVFRHARDAVTAALVLQAALAAESWATSTPIRVRMAVHTGQIHLRDGDYYGPTVNRCARLRALARGGQVLLSGRTAELVASQLPGGASLRDLGTHELKDLNAPEHVWQLVHPQMAPHAPAAAKPASPSGHRAYVLTDHLNRSADGRQWGEQVRHVADEDGSIRCYVSPTLAALLNPLYERVRLPRLWEAAVDHEPDAGQPGVVACREATSIRQVAMASLSALHIARFAVVCARAAYEAGAYAVEFNNWADSFLSGHDTSGVTARELADELEAEALRGATVAYPEELMVAKAARAAALASRVAWLAGRARDEENTRVIELASEAVRSALRMAQLDLVAMADVAVPRSVSAVSAVRQLAPVAAPNRILTTLPT